MRLNSRAMRRTLVAIMASFALIVVAACGDDDADGAEATANDDTQPESGSNGATGASFRGITDTTITIGGIGNRNFAGAEEGAKARIERANKEGGVDGRTIEFVGVRDDENDGDRNLALVRELVDRDGVFAIVPLNSGALQPSAGAFMDEAGVPFIGIGSRPSYCDDTQNGFGHNGCLLDASTYNSSVADPLGELFDNGLEGVKFAISSMGDEAGQRSVDQAKAVIEARGGEVVYAEANVPRGGGIDFQPFVDSILAAKPEAVLLSQDFPNSLGLKRLLVAAGFNGPIADYLTYVPGLLDSSPDVKVALEGTYIISSLTPTLEDGTPYVKQMLEDFEAAGVANPTLGAILGYVQTDLFIAMADAVDGDFASFAEIINAGFEYEPEEGGVPVRFPENRTLAVPCAGLVTVHNGAYSTVVPYSCYENLPRNG